MPRPRQFVKPGRKLKASSRTTGTPHAEKSIWALLDKPFALWLLSAIFLTGGSWAFATWDTWRKDKESTRIKIEKLDAEIAFRLATAGVFDQASRAYVIDPKALALDPQEAIRRETARRVLDPPEKGRVLFSEYAERGLQTLIKELELLLRTDENSTDYVCVQKASAHLMSYLESEGPIETFRRAKSIENTSLILGAYRWGPTDESHWQMLLVKHTLYRERLEIYLPDELNEKSGSCQSSSVKALARASRTLPRAAPRRAPG